MKYAVLTLSDKGAKGEREDTSGPAIREMMDAAGGECVFHEILPDDPEAIEAALMHLCDEMGARIVLTTGGTGFSPRDWTPEATLAVCDRLAPGLAEAMRAASLAHTPHAMLSRAVAGLRGASLIVNLPGSRKAVVECLQVILPALPHACEILAGDGTDCGRPFVK